MTCKVVFVCGVRDIVVYMNSHELMLLLVLNQKP